MQREATKNLEHTEITNKREAHYQNQLTEQIKKVKQLEE